MSGIGRFKADVRFRFARESACVAPRGKGFDPPHLHQRETSFVCLDESRFFLSFLK